MENCCCRDTDITSVVRQNVLTVTNIKENISNEAYKLKSDPLNLQTHSQTVQVRLKTKTLKLVFIGIDINELPFHKF